MSHAFHDGFFVKQPAWHKLGTLLAEYPTLEQAYEMAGHNFTVANLPCFDNEGKELPSYIRRVARTDTNATIGSCASGYVPVQNKELYEFMKVMQGESDIKLDTGGTLKGGTYVWLLANAGASSPAGDAMKRYLLIYNRHDAGASLRMQLTNVRVQCMNTLSMAIRETNDNIIRIRHTTKVQEHIAQAKAALAHAREHFSEFDQLVTLLAAHPATAQFVETIALRLWEKSESKAVETKQEAHRRAVLNNFREYSKRNAQQAAGATLWGAVNAFTHYVDHQMLFQAPKGMRTAASMRAAASRHKRKLESPEFSERTFETTLLGRNMKLKQQAVEYVCEEASKSWNGFKSDYDTLLDSFNRN